MDNEAAIAASCLVVEKDKKPIIGELDFEVRRGSITGLIGPSGSGKTTLMRSIVGVQRSSHGELTVLGHKAGSSKLRGSIGYVTQDPAVYSDLTVRQNLAYFGSLMGSDRKQVEKIIKHVQLQNQANQVVLSLSGGQRARVSLAVALLGDPDLYVFDEPTVGLDPILRNELWDMFRDLANSGKTLLISSHVMDEADRCENLLLMREGKLLWSDTRKGLLNETGKSNVGDAFVAMIERSEGK